MGAKRRYSVPRGGWHNPASRENAKLGGRPRSRVVLRGPAAIYVWAVARQEFGRLATDEQAEQILDRMVQEYARNHPTPDEE